MEDTQKSVSSAEEMQARIQARMDAIEAARLVANAPIVNDPDDRTTSSMKFGRPISRETEQRIRTMISHFATVKGDEYTKKIGEDSSSRLRTEPDGTTSLEATKQVLGEMKREVLQAMQLRRIPETLKELAHTPAEKAEDVIVQGGRWTSEKTNPTHTESPVSLEVQSIGHGDLRDSVVALVREETRKAREAGLASVVEPAVINRSSKESGNTTKILLDERVADRMMARIQEERDQINSSIAQNLAEMKSSQRGAVAAR